MTLFYDYLKTAYLGYAAIFVCLGLGFLFLRRVDEGEVGPGYWAISFFLNSLGFLLWSGVIPLLPRQYFLLGELFHISGFLFLVCGAYRFTGNAYKAWNLVAILAWLALWAASILVLRSIPVLGMLGLKALRTVLMVWAGGMILAKPANPRPLGRSLAGWSLIAWGLYILATGFVHLPSMLHLAFGFLVGFQILAALGIVAMVVERMRLRAEKSEKLLASLEGLLPICAYCKKIRDEGDNWQTIESYIEERSAAEFSHGICPECKEKHFPGLGTPGPAGEKP